MKVLVTGASGFFGRAIARDLRAHGHEVYGAARRPDGTGATIALDITDRVAVRTAFEAGYDAVAHSAALAHVKLAAADTARVDAINAIGAANVAEAAAAAGVAHYVFISSVVVYGDHSLGAVVAEDSPLRAGNAYATAKLAAERATLGVPGPMRRTILRMTTMYAPDWLLNLRKRVAVPFGGRRLRFSLDPGTPRYSLCGREGGASLVRTALEACLPDTIYNVADDHVYSVREIAAAIARLEGPALTLRVPLVLPRFALALSRKFATPAKAEAARSRYWKFCEHNVYSTARLAAAGMRLPPQLLEIAAKRGGVVS